MKTHKLNRWRGTWRQLALGLAAGSALLAGSAHAGTWSRSAWTGDSSSGIGTAAVPPAVPADYTMAVNTGSGDAAVTVNGITFSAHATSGTNFSMGGAFAFASRNVSATITGSSTTLANNFLYNGAPRTVTLSNLVVGTRYETSFFAYGWEGSGRIVTFSSGSDSLTVDQDFYGDSQGIRVAYDFTAAATTQVISIAIGPGGNGGTFHMSALANRRIPVPPATITLFGSNVAGSSAVISPVVANAGTIAWTVPYGTNLATLAPTFTLSTPTSTCDRVSGAVPSPDFSSGPLAYTVTDGATTNVYTVTAAAAPASTARDIVTFNANSPGSNAIITGTGANTGTVEIVVPFGTPSVLVGAIAPTFTVSAGATCDKVSGTRPTPNLSIGGTVHYIVTAQDGVSTKDYSVTVRRSNWRYSPWTGDADSGITGVQADYLVAANIGTGGDAAVTVNGIAFTTHALTGTNYTLAPANADATGRSSNVTGSSKTLADNFLYNGSPRTVTLSNLTVGETYEASLFAYAWDASGRVQTFAAGSDTYVADQDAFGNNNGIRFSYTFVAAATSQVLTVTPVPGGQGTFHMSALANRHVTLPADSDADLLADAWEMAQAGDLTSLTGLVNGPGPGPGTGDFDGDGLSDSDEFTLAGNYPALSAISADSDGDGLNDYAELLPTAPRAATNPTNPDTDGDGLSDLVENNSGVFVNAGNPGTNPTSVDSDNDQYPDVYEIGHGGNPVLGTSYPSILPAGIALGVVTDEVSTGISATGIFTHKISGGGAATVNGVVLDILDPSTTPANFTWNDNGFGKNSIPANNGTWNPVVGNVTGAGNLQMFGSFTYSGGGPNPGNSQQYVLSALEPGLTYELRLFIRKWDDGTVRPHNLKFTNGAQITNFYLLEDRPGIVLGNGNNESGYYVSFTYMAQSSTMTLEATVASVATGNGSFHLYGLTNRQASEPPALDFTSTVRAANGSSMTLTWASRPSHIYKVEFSTDLVNWIELTDAHPSGGTSTTYVDSLASGLQRAQYKVTDVTP